MKQTIYMVYKSVEPLILLNNDIFNSRVPNSYGADPIFIGKPVYITTEERRLQELLSENKDYFYITKNMSWAGESLVLVRRGERWSLDDKWTYDREKEKEAVLKPVSLVKKLINKLFSLDKKS